MKKFEFYDNVKELIYDNFLKAFKKDGEEKIAFLNELLKENGFDEKVKRIEFHSDPDKCDVYNVTITTTRLNVVLRYNTEQLGKYNG